MRLPDVVLTEYGKQMANPDPEGKWEIANWAMPNTSILSIYTNNMLSHILTRCLGDHSFSFRAHLCCNSGFRRRFRTLASSIGDEAF